MTEDQIALQLYTVRELTAQDMVGTLRRLAEIGYRAVQPAGYGNSSPEEIRRVLDECGMRAISAHVDLQRWEDPEAVFEELETLGCSHAVVPFLPERRRSQAQVQKLIEQFNRWGEQCREHGLRFSYHNHAFEFAPLGDTTIWEMLVAGTDPTLVGLELDVYWAQYAGRAPVEIIGQIAGRMPLLHLKDMANTPDRADAPVGTGVINFDAILPAAARAGAEWYIVEQDTSTSPLEDVQTSLRYLQEQAKRPSIGTMPHSQPM